MFKVTEDLYASKGNRFVNYIIDRIVFYVLALGFFFLIGVILVFIGGAVEEIAYEMQNINPLLDRIMTMILFSFFYFFSEVLLKGRTVGKYVTKTIVVDENGNIPHYTTILKRSLCRLIPFNAFSFLGHNSRGWHDSISGTYVVEKQRLDNKKQSVETLDQIGVI